MDPEDPDSDPDHSQNLIKSSFYHFEHILKILSKSVCQFLSCLVHKQTNRGPQMTLGQVLWRSVDDILCNGGGLPPLFEIPRINTV